MYTAVYRTQIHPKRKFREDNLWKKIDDALLIYLRQYSFPI